MRFVRWNSFTVIGLVLVIIGIVGEIKGAKFEFDAGVPAELHEALYYILVGVLFLINGFVLSEPVTVAGEEPESAAVVSSAVAVPPAQQSPSGAQAATPAPVQTKQV